MIAAKNLCTSTALTAANDNYYLRLITADDRSSGPDLGFAYSNRNKQAAASSSMPRAPSTTT